MKSILLATAAFAALTVTASAADMALKAPPLAAPVPAFSWTGCYIGAHVGAGSQKDTWVSDVEGGASNGFNGVGAIAGGQVGCNYQVGVLVLGLEGEGYWSGIKNTLENGSFFGGGSWLETKNKYDFDIAARFGFAFDRALIYGKAGWVWGRFDFDSSFGGFYSHVGEATLNGLLLGVGGEYALTNNWTVKLEYNYLNFGSKRVDFSHCEAGVCVPEFYQSVSADKHIVKLGANYKFDWGAPVVARY